MANTYMSIARDERLTKVQHDALLPSDTGTLYQLSRLNDDEWTRITPHLTPELQRKEVRRYAAERVRDITWTASWTTTTR